MGSESESEYEYLSDNSDQHFDDNYPDTGPKFNLEFIFVDYEKFPDIYDPLFPYIELLSQETFNNILSFLSDKDILNLRLSNVFIKQNVDFFSELNNKIFCTLKSLSIREYEKKTNNINVVSIKKYYRNRLCSRTNSMKWYSLIKKFNRYLFLKTIKIL